jgi:acetoin utilization protein AcuC
VLGFATVAQATANTVLVVAGERLARYGFGAGHPFGTDRHDAFWREFNRRGLQLRTLVEEPRAATPEELLRFHSAEYVEEVRQKSRDGQGWLDGGDTPAYQRVFEDASTVVGAALGASEALMTGRAQRAFVPIAGLHHAARHRAAGFCVFNDIGVVIETLLCNGGLLRVGYVDIDAHHGDGVFYGFETDPRVIFADLHEDGRFLYPGTGAASEIGRGPAVGTKLNIPLPAGADDATFALEWPKVMAHLRAFAPEFILLQCGADSMAGDPITHLAWTAESHRRAARELASLADELGHGRVLAVGGGGYNRGNLAAAWNNVVEALIDG